MSTETLRPLAVLALVLLAGCASPPHVVVTGKPQDGLLARCLDAPEGKVGKTNESLAQAFLVTRQSLRTCKGVAQAIQDNP